VIEDPVWGGVSSPPFESVSCSVVDVEVAWLIVRISSPHVLLEALMLLAASPE